MISLLLLFCHTFFVSVEEFLSLNISYNDVAIAMVAITIISRSYIGGDL